MTRNSMKIGLALATLVISGSHALAVSREVRIACRSDYFAFCSQHSVGSQALRQCMRSHAKQLSSSCKTALIRSGEAGKTSVARRGN